MIVLALIALALALKIWSVDAVPDRMLQLDLICAISSGSLHWNDVRPKCWPLSHSIVVIFLVRA